MMPHLVLSRALSRLADRLVLFPTRRPLLAVGKTRRLLEWSGGHVELWTVRTCGEGSDRGFGDDPHEPRCLVVQFNGKNARAERTGIDPLDTWSDLPGEIWSVNPPGYGGSSGRASLESLAPVADRVFRAAMHEAAGRPIVLTGNSLGTLSCLYLAARYADESSLAGLILHNAPPLADLIKQHYGRATLGLSRFIAERVPAELDSVSNGRLGDAPALFLTAGQDTVVPPAFQRRVVRAYAGPRQHLVLPDAAHEIRFTRRTRAAYARGLAWLREQIGELATNAESTGSAVYAS
jgi:uncharacterized protein